MVAIDAMVESALRLRSRIGVSSAVASSMARLVSSSSSRSLAADRLASSRSARDRRQQRYPAFRRCLRQASMAFSMIAGLDAVLDCTADELGDAALAAPRATRRVRARP